jgi:hypothetical protein
MGNGPDSSGFNWSTTNHPGVNINGPYIPPVAPGGTFVSHGTHFDIKNVVNAAGMLLHETSHLSNPNNAAASMQQYENTAYTYEAQELCKVAGCPGPAGEQYNACRLIKDCNAQLCANGGTQQQCPACLDLLPPVIVTVTCPPSPPPGDGEPLAYNQFLSSHNQPIQPELLPTYQAELYAEGTLMGKITLDGVAERITLDYQSESGDCYAEIDLSSASGLGIVPLTFTQFSANSLLVAGIDRSTMNGKLIKIVYDVPTSSVTSVTTLYSGSAFKRPSSMSMLPGVPQVALLDASTHSVYVYDIRASTTTLVANPALVPGLENANFVHSSAYQASGRSQTGLLISASSDPYELDRGTLTAHCYLMIDTDGDGIFDCFL